MPDSSASRRVLIVGFGPVGHRCAATLAQRCPTDSITIVGEEPDFAYDRVHISSYVGSWDRSQLTLDDLPEQVTHVHDRIVSVDPQARVATGESGQSFPYDELILATGSSAFVPPIPGHDLPQCFVYRTLDDLDAIRTAVERAASSRPAGQAAHARPVGVVIGGGLLGLEAAGALQTLGMDTHVIEMAPRLMPLQVDEEGGALLAATLTEMGVTVHVGAATASISEEDDSRVTLDLGEQGTVTADLVVFSAGIRPRDELAEAAGIERGPRGGFLTNRLCHTNVEHVRAIGECAAVDGSVYGLIAPGNSMSDIVVDELSGGSPAEFKDPDMSTKLKLLGVDVASFGEPFAHGASVADISVHDPLGGTHKKLLIDRETGMLIGGVLVGDADSYSLLRPMVGHELPSEPISFISSGDGGGASIGVGALPDDAQICSCNDVSKADVTTAIHDGAHTVDALKKCTNAGTSCGSCIGLLSQLLDAEGIEQSRALCEHFPQTRAELFEIAQATDIRTFGEFIARFGTGGGCEICKPTLASIFATLHTGDHVLDDGRAALQDTNDRFLANMQRNGTYSVCPRLPAGQVTAEQLTVISSIASDFDLHLKISGAQRIVMFGARVDQLPEIWRRLVDAGMESGQAYGKSLRAVKSCVGTDWCRYGQQDSVGLAVKLELRYRGLRSPHKFKMGVSGCARECAEARGKDIGVIATEKGWNLYVGGNGGATPRHAELLARDVSTDDLIRYIDRYLGFYVRTADRLQRTAAWQEAFDGGLDHIRDVVIDDSLGIAADLEAFVEAHVDAYQDEWAAVLSDPEKLRRFVSFVNAPESPDPPVQCGHDHGRKIPLPMPALVH